jgi:hypothetical protein
MGHPYSDAHFQAAKTTDSRGDYAHVTAPIETSVKSMDVKISPRERECVSGMVQKYLGVWSTGVRMVASETICVSGMVHKSHCVQLRAVPIPESRTAVV